MAKPKKQIAVMIAMHQGGHSPREIGRTLTCSHNTVTAYLSHAAQYLADPAIKGMVEKWRETEIDDLVILRAKARARLHEQLDDDKMKPIELIALQDRAFQQSRTLEGLSNFNVFHGVMVKIQNEALALTMKSLSKPAKGTEKTGRPRAKRERAATA